jgi:hypothetical protein
MGGPIIMKKLFLSVLALIAFISVLTTGKNAFAFTHHVGQFRFTDSSVRTAEDIDLDFTPEKAEWVYGKVRVLGRVTNKTNRSYRFVKITFSAMGTGHGNLLGRTFTFTDPSDIGPREVGYIDRRIDCNNQKPNDIEYKITGQEE